MNRQAWMMVGLIAVVTVATAYLVKRKTAETDSSTAANSQIPSEDAEANYSVPPSIGTQQVEGGIYVPPGSGVTYTSSQGNSLPTS